MSMVHSKQFEFKVVLHSFEDNLIMSIDKGFSFMGFQTPNVPTLTGFSLPATGFPRNFTAVTLFKPEAYFIGTEGG